MVYPGDMMLRRYFGKISKLPINSFIGHNGELVVDEETNRLYIMDGINPGGVELLSNGNNGNVSVGPTGPTGVTGPAGSSGPTGLRGLVGAFGPPGATGPAGGVGPTGTQGPQGPQGNLGPTGPVGSQGIPGNQGIQGIQGTQGNIGPTGPQGSSGPQGIQGIQGNQGNVGPTGPQGNLGPQGIQGTQGQQGVSGPQGDPGPRGLQGNQGAAVTLKGSVTNPGSLPNSGQNPGDAWIDQSSGNLYFWNSSASTWDNVGKIVGPKGDIGDPGPRGFQGNAGPTGSQGSSGPQGIQGIQGAQGNAGPTGPQGASGPQGIQGIQGAQGNAGPTGPQGASGPQGLQGVPGSAGAQGEIGPTGPQGTAGEPGPTGPAPLWTYRGAYDPAIGYVEGDLVTYNSSLWYRLAMFSGMMGVTPGSDSTIWVVAAGAAAGGGGGGSSSGGALDGGGGGAVSSSTGGWYFSGLGSVPQFFTNLYDSVIGVGTDFAGNTFASNLSVIASNKTWKFNNLGNFVLPSNGDIIRDGVSVLGGNGGGVTDRLVNGELNLILGIDGAVNLPRCDALPHGSLIQTTFDIQLNANGRFYNFASDGYVAFPDGSKLNVVPESGIATFQATTDYAIQTNETGPIWNFGSDGVLTLPNDIMVGAGINSDEGHIYIDGSLNGSTSIRWINASENYNKLIKLFLDDKSTMLNQRLEVGIQDGDYYVTTTNSVDGIGNEPNLDHTWKFYNNGSTGFPEDMIFTGENPITVKSYNFSELLYENPNTPFNANDVINSFVGVDNDGIYLATVAINSDNTDVNVSSWAIDKNGNLITDIMHEFADNTTGDITDASGNSLVYVPTTDTAPEHDHTGLLWFNTEDGRTYIRYNHQWVDSSPAVVPAVSTYLDGLLIEGQTISSADYENPAVKIDGDLEPEQNLTYSLGSPSKQWKHLYVDSHSIYMGGKALSISNKGLQIDGESAVYEIDGGTASTWLTA